MTSDRLTAESFRAAFDRMIEKGDQEQRQRGERSREITARGRAKSKLGQILDSNYIAGGPMILHPAAHVQLTELLAEEERRADAGEEQQLSDEDAMRIALAGWGGTVTG